MSVIPHPTRTAGALLALLLAAPAPAADDARLQELERRLERSLQMIEALNAKVRQLEQAAATPAPSSLTITTTDPRQDKRIDELQQRVSELTAARAHHDDGDGLPLHGFLDVGAGSSSEDNIDRNGNRRRGSKGFTVGTFDLYLTPRFGDRVKALVEFAVELEENGEAHSDLERAQIGYSFGDAATAWLGRFHTPYGYWNTAFHHGMQFQTSILRPRFLDFEDKGGILPAHTVGAWVNGSLSSAAGRVGYDLYAGNAPGLRIEARNVAGTLDMKLGGAGTHASTTGFNLSLRPERAPDLLLGAHGLRLARVEDDRFGLASRVAMLGGYAVFSDERWEAMAEVYRFRNRDLSGAGGSHRSSAWYAQLGYNFGQLTPFARVERTRLDQADNFFLLQESGRSYARATIGARYELDPKAAIKLELNRTRQDDTGGPGLRLRDDYSEARFQYAIRF